MLAAACFSLLDIQNEGCRVLCVRDGYTRGNMEKGSCICAESKGKYEDFIVRRVRNLGEPAQKSEGSLSIRIPTGSRVFDPDPAYEEH